MVVGIGRDESTLAIGWRGRASAGPGEESFGEGKGIHDRMRRLPMR